MQVSLQSSMKAATFYVPPYTLLIASSRLQEARGGLSPDLVPSPLFDQETRREHQGKAVIPGTTLCLSLPSQGHCLRSCSGLLPIPWSYGVEGTEPSTPRGLPHPHPGLYAPPAPLISPSNSFLLSTLKTGISASKCQLQLGEAGTHQGLPPRQIYRAIKLSLGESGRGSS